MGNTKQVRTLVVGGEESFERVKSIIYQSKKSVHIIGRIAIEETDTITSLGTLSGLIHCVNYYKPNEIIFCSSEINNSQVIDYLSHENKLKCRIKILPPNCSFIIGSNDKNELGDYYAIENSYRLAAKGAKLNKRLFDLVICFVAILVLPFTKIKWRDWSTVLIGKKTWVGYNLQVSIESLPKIKEGVFQIYHNQVNKQNSQLEFIDKANQFYALHYTFNMDLDIVSKAI